MHMPSSIRAAFAHLQKPVCRTSRRCSTAAAGSGAIGPLALGLASAPLVVRLGSGLLLGAAGGAAIWQSQGSSEDLAPCSSSQLPFVRELQAKSSVVEVDTPGNQLRKHPLGKLLVEQDHLFEAMVQSGQILELRCFYDQEERKFHSVVVLGKDVCGFPQTVHGGLTAAIVDETFGGLGVGLWKAGVLGFRPPAYTARLEVDYKKKIPAGAVILCTTELEKAEDRKLWMTAKVTNGSGMVYATARALFVAPRLLGWIPRFDNK